MPTMIEAYYNFIKQTSGKNLAEHPPEDRCKGLFCDKIECRIACGFLRLEKLKNRKKK